MEALLVHVGNGSLTFILSPTGCGSGKPKGPGMLDESIWSKSTAATGGGYTGKHVGMNGIGVKLLLMNKVSGMIPVLEELKAPATSDGVIFVNKLCGLNAAGCEGGVVVGGVVVGGGSGFLGVYSSCIQLVSLLKEEDVDSGCVVEEEEERGSFDFMDTGNAVWVSGSTSYSSALSVSSSFSGSFFRMTEGKAGGVRAGEV